MSAPRRTKTARAPETVYGDVMDVVLELERLDRRLADLARELGRLPDSRAGDRLARRDYAALERTLDSRTPFVSWWLRGTLADRATAGLDIRAFAREVRADLRPELGCLQAAQAVEL